MFQELMSEENREAANLRHVSAKLFITIRNFVFIITRVPAVGLTSRSILARINRDMITRTAVSIKISHPATFINFTSGVRAHVNYLSRFAFTVTMMYRRPHKKCERENHVGRAIS
jgi:hypothetical protein